MAGFSRRQLASYAAAALAAGGGAAVVERLAAYLVAEKRTKEAPLLALDIEKAFLQHGTVVARAKSAHRLEPTEQASIAKMLQQRYGVHDVQLQTDVEEQLLGGVVVRTASDEFDGSLKRSINRLKALKGGA